MAKKKAKEVNLDDLEQEFEEELEEIEEKVEEETAKIEEIEEFSLEEVSEEGEVEEVFEEEIEAEEEEVTPEEEIIDERIYIVPLAKARRGPRTKWAKKSIRYLRNFMEQHFKPESLIISQELNEKIWSRGISKPPRKVKIRATKNVDGLVVVYLAE